LRLWYEVDSLRRAVPAPMPSQDHFNVMVPAHFLCGTPEAVDFFKELYDEVKERVESKTGVIEDEKYCFRVVPEVFRECLCILLVLMLAPL